MLKNFNKEYFSKFFLRCSAFVLRISAIVHIYLVYWNKNKSQGIFASLALIAVGGLFFVGYVKADTSATTVTVGNSAPTLTVTLDRTTITLSENTYVWASTTLTITDGNGCSSIGVVEASLVFASTTADQGANICGSTSANYAMDAKLCYVPDPCVATTTGTTCATTVVDYDCGFKIWYAAQPSDNSAPGAELSDGQWVVVGSTTDNVVSATATNTTQTVEVATLNALDISANITYPETAANANTGGTNQTVTHTNTGNTAIDNQIGGDVMCNTFTPGGGPGACSGNSFTQDNQKFDLIDQTYASLTYTLAASSSPATIEVVLGTSTATTTAETDLSYWGIAIPAGQTNGSYTGENTFTAVAD